MFRHFLHLFEHFALYFHLKTKGLLADRLVTDTTEGENMAEAKEAAPAKPKNSGMILQIAFAVLNLAVMGGGAYLVYASTIGYSHPAITEQKMQAELASMEADTGDAPLIYTMEQFTLNLAGSPKRTIRLEVNLEMLGKDGFEEVMDTDNRARARDKVLRIINDKTFAELETIQGKLFLKDKIAADINSILKKGVVKDVYFTSFVVQ